MHRIETYPFEGSDFLHYFKNLYRDRGLKAIYQILNRPHRRPYSRSLIKKYAPEGHGIEVGCGTRTICPTDRTVLSDAFSSHGVDDSIARVFFEGDKIPYEDETFSFLVSEHVLEHIANPIKALKEWIRVLEKHGKLFCFLPHKERTNDVHRETTSLEHLIEDYEKDVPFNDDTHLNEWMENVVGRGLMPEHYKHLSREELLESASIHHHNWTQKEIVALFEYLNLEVIFVDERVHDRRDTFVVVGKKK